MNTMNITEHAQKLESYYITSLTKMRSYDFVQQCSTRCLRRQSDMIDLSLNGYKIWILQKSLATKIFSESKSTDLFVVNFLVARELTTQHNY